MARARSSIFGPVHRVALAATLACWAGAPRGWSQDKGAEPDKAVAAIQKAGGKVERDEASPDKPVVVVNFATTQADDAALEPIKGLAKLRKLTLNGTKVTDAGLEHLKGMAELRKLYLVDTKITDAGLERLKGLTGLQVLSLVGTQVTDAGLEHVKGMTGLKELFVYGTKVSDEGVAALKKARPELKVDR